MALHLVNLRWLIRLRWLLLAAAVALLVATEAWLGGLAVGPMLGVLAVGAASNLGLYAWVERGAVPQGPGVAAVALGVDVVGLTSLLALSGGAHNPFSFLYLLEVMVAALVLPTRLSWGFVAAGAALYGGLFLSEPPAAVHDPEQMRRHLVGMWTAYAVCGPFVAFAVARLRAAVAEADARMLAARALEERTARLASLATLAAGAAHELASPLGTIAVVAGEWVRAADPELRGDGELVKREVERCRGVLQQLAADAGAGMGEPPRPVELSALIAASLEGIDGVELGCEPVHVLAAPRLFGQALRRLVANAQQASPPGTPVHVTCAVEDEVVRLRVIDRGVGMSPEVLAHVGEPFFTTREPGRGMGLGLYFARAVFEHCGGGLTLTSAPGAGTTAIVTLPLERT